MAQEDEDQDDGNFSVSGFGIIRRTYLRLKLTIQRRSVRKGARINYKIHSA